MNEPFTIKNVTYQQFEQALYKWRGSGARIVPRGLFGGYDVNVLGVAGRVQYDPQSQQVSVEITRRPPIVPIELIQAQFTAVLEGRL